jgi:hypothetical protein
MDAGAARISGGENRRHSRRRDLNSKEFCHLSNANFRAGYGEIMAHLRKGAQAEAYATNRGEMRKAFTKA